MGSITSSNSWVTLDEAEVYLVTRLGSSKVWNEGLSEPEKEAALITAFNQLNNCKIFSIPADITTAVKYAQCEMALFLLMHQEDIDLRMGLQSQGVTSSNVAGESYNLDFVNGVPVPAQVKNLLKDYIVETNFYAVDVARDDDEDV